MQALGSAMTYARRYGLAAMVGVAPEDDDGAAAVEPDTRAVAKPIPEGSRGLGDRSHLGRRQRSGGPQAAWTASKPVIAPTPGRASWTG